jgi:hypothetical protein
LVKLDEVPVATIFPRRPFFEARKAGGRVGRLSSAKGMAFLRKAVIISTRSERNTAEDDSSP